MKIESNFYKRDFFSTNNNFDLTIFGIKSLNFSNDFLLNQTRDFKLNLVYQLTFFIKTEIDFWKKKKLKPIDNKKK